MIFATHQETVRAIRARENRCSIIHRKASEFMMANKAAVADMTVAKFGANRVAVENAARRRQRRVHVELTDTVLAQSRTYAEHMLELKQIRALPDFAKSSIRPSQKPSPHFGPARRPSSKGHEMALC